jgi:tetratricopeptide (TPR) repeat protein
MGFAVVAAGLAFGSASFFYLAVDTLSAGVFGGQRGIPFASIYRQDPDRMLEFAVNVQKINQNRGLPALVEASLLERKIKFDDSDKFAERTLAAYERAVEIDPWNGSAWLGIAVFLESHPRLRERRADARSPEALVLASLEIDPLFVPGIDWLVERYERTGRMQEAYGLVRKNIFPWLRFLGREQPEAAVTYFRFLRARAEQYGDQEVISALEMLRRG